LADFDDGESTFSRWTVFERLGKPLMKTSADSRKPVSTNRLVPRKEKMRAPKFILIATFAGATLVSSAFAQTKDIVDTAVGAGSFKTLVAAVQAAGLVDALKGSGPLTVLAPTDEAFAKLPPATLESLLKPENKQQLVDILTYHVIPGAVKSETVATLTQAKTLNGQQIDISATESGVAVDNANVVQVDIECTNGVIHVIDSVILPESKDIPTIASEAGTFGTLIAAAQAAGLVEALSGKGPLTVFAPTDDAFGRLPQGTIASLLKPENKQQLADILKYHVISGRVYAADALNAKSAPTLQGNTVSISAAESGAKINDAATLSTDIDASNGVIHVIDRVLLPPTGQSGNVQQAQVSPRVMIEQAIAAGAPMYNSGHVAQCAQLYMDTVEGILSRADHGLSARAAKSMQGALAQAKTQSSMDSRAWTLRHAMDSAYNAMR